MSSEDGLKQTKLTDATYTPIGLIVWDRAVIQNRFFFLNRPPEQSAKFVQFSTTHAPEIRKGRSAEFFF
jgi:hypothetical protein